MCVCINFSTNVLMKNVLVSTDGYPYSIYSLLSLDRQVSELQKEKRLTKLKMEEMEHALDAEKTLSLKLNDDVGVCRFWGSHTVFIATQICLNSINVQYIVATPTFPFPFPFPQIHDLHHEYDRQKMEHMKAMAQLQQQSSQLEVMSREVNTLTSLPPSPFPAP